MIIDNIMRDGKLEYEVNKVTSKISASSSGNIDKYE